jgi:hypothetical protein
MSCLKNYNYNEGGGMAGPIEEEVGGADSVVTPSLVDGGMMRGGM